MKTVRPFPQLVLVATCLILFLATPAAHAQIPKEAVDAALKGPVRVFMLTASSDHDYAHRTQVTPAKITRTGNTIVAEGRLQNIVKNDDDGFMKYLITCKGKEPPVIEIFDVEESKDTSRRLKNTTLSCWTSCCRARMDGRSSPRCARTAVTRRSYV